MTTPEPPSPMEMPAIRKTWRLSLSSITRIASVVHGNKLSPAAGDAVFSPHIDRANNTVARGSKRVKGAVGSKVDRPVTRAAKDIDVLERFDDTQRIKLESGEVMSLREGRRTMARDRAKMDADSTLGNGAHHARTSSITRVLPYLLAALEVIMLGLLFREIANAWGSALRLVAVVVLPIALVALQFALIKQVASAENTRREALAEGNLAAEAVAGGTYRRWLAPAVVVALVAASLVAYRVFTWMSASFHPMAEVVLMTAFGFLAGLAPSIVKYLAIARDGSTTSRRFTDTSQQVARADKRRESTTRRADKMLVRADNANFRIKTGIFAEISHRIDRVFDLAWREWAAAHALAGLKPPTMPEPQFVEVTRLDRGTGMPAATERVPLPFVEIPGSRQPDLMPARVAYGVITDADVRIASLRQRLVNAGKTRDDDQPQLAITGS